MGWLAAHMPRDGSVAIREVTNAWAVLNVVGIELPPASGPAPAPEARQAVGPKSRAFSVLG